MASQDNEQELRVVAAVVIALLVLVVGGVIGLGVHRAGAERPAAAAPAAAVTATAVVVADDASVIVENGVVKFYFATGKAELAQGAAAALADPIAAALGGKKLAISGFHDATGSADANAELAKQRALAVRQVLMAAGVAEPSLELRKPEVTTGSGNNAEARRVEVVVLP